MARASGRLARINEAIRVAVDEHARDVDHVAARSTLLPELSARTTPEGGAPGLERRADGFARGKREPADLARELVLHDDRDETPFLESDRQSVHRCDPRLPLRFAHAPC